MSLNTSANRFQFSSTLASFPSLADYSSVKLTSEKAIKAAEDHKYFTFTQNLPEASFNLSRAAQTVKFSPDNGIIQVQLVVFTDSSFTDNSDLLSQINYATYLADATNRIKYKGVTRGVLAAELYAIAHRFDIEKQHWERYQIVQKKSYQHQHYRMGGTGRV